MISVIRLYPPLPIIVHARLGYGFDLGSNLVLAQLVGTDPGGIISTTHVANLVDPTLEWANSAASEGA